MVNSVPKSGTNLMIQLVLGIPGLRTAKFVNTQNIHELHSMLPNELPAGHVMYSENIHLFLQKLGIRQIFVYRDFRDIVVSWAHFIINKHHAHPLYHFYDRYLNRRFEDLVTHVIEGVQHPQCRYPGVYEEFRPIFPWREVPGILALRYEDLVRDQESRLHSCRKILDYLYGNSINENIKNHVIHLMMQNVKSEESWSYRRGAIGDWKTELNDRQKAVLKKQVGPLLVRWGYEKDENW
ncbi:sulfotransferase domain-containing protein [Polycladomyces zharkentensis]|nr:sulfotransferase domain-containing protein [Polycladomyces sp. WAk]